jgi:hypothetical protein
MKGPGFKTLSPLRAICLPLSGPCVTLLVTIFVYLVVGLQHPSWQVPSGAATAPTTVSEGMEDMRSRVTWSVAWIGYVVAALLAMFLALRIGIRHWSVVSHPVLVILVLVSVAGIGLLTLVLSDTSGRHADVGGMLLKMPLAWGRIQIRGLGFASNVLGATALMSVLFAVGVSLAKFEKSEVAGWETLECVETIKSLLSSSATALVLGVCATYLLFSWSATTASSNPSKTEVTRVAETISGGLGVLFSIMLAAAFIPTWRRIRIRTIACLRAGDPTMTPERLKAELRQVGFDTKWPEVLGRYFAILAPALAALVGGPLAEGLKSMGK